MMRGERASMMLIVSWPLLATKTRRPSGDGTMFQGSAPVRKVLDTAARKLSGFALRMRMTDTVPAAALATNA